MKKKYNVSGRQWWLLVLWALGFGLPAGAQNTQPPVIQWQRVLDPGSTSPVQSVKASNGGYAVINSGRVIRLSESGSTLWDIELPVSDALPAYNRAFAITALPDGGFTVLTRGFSQWSLARIDANGTVLWIKPFVYRSSSNSVVQTSFSNLINISDGGYVVMGNTSNGRDGTYINLYKFDVGGNETFHDQVFIKVHNGTSSPVADAKQIIQARDGGYILVGDTRDIDNSTVGMVAKVDPNFNLVWQYGYGVGSFEDIIHSPYDYYAYLVVGSKDPSTTWLVNVGPSGEPTGNVQSVGRKPNTSSRIVSTQNSASHTVVDVYDDRNGDLKLISSTSPLSGSGVKIIGGSQVETIQSAVATDDKGVLIVGTTTSTDGDVQGKTNNDLATWIVKLAPANSPAPVNPLTLTAPTYNCQTGAITFNTSGGNGSPIIYSAPGISRANTTDNFGTVEPGLRNDPKPITITATQSGNTVSYVFDFGAFCGNVPPNEMLKLLAPTIECRSLDAAIVINTTGGDGSTITYTVPGATLSSPASNTAFVFECINAENPSLSIQATQSGYTATYPLDLYRACPNTNFGDALIARQIPDLTLSAGQNLQAYDVSQYFTDPNNFLRYNLVASYSFSATGMPEGITYSTLGTNSTNGLVAKFLGTAPAQPGVYTVTITAGTIFCDPVVTSFKIIVTVNPPTGGNLTLTQPTYNCQTGAITFNTSGGDGSPITYSAPGISRANATDNFGTVEQGLRGDPKPITITATQSGKTVSYVFDFGAFCSGNPQPPVSPPTILPPVVNGPIPPMTRRADSSRPTVPFVISDYFSDPTPAHAGYRSNLRFSVDASAPGFFSKLPLGYFLKDLSAVEAPYAIIAGSSTFEGSYTVTVTATNLNLPPPNNSVSTTLSVEIIGRPESNPDDALRLTAPLYDCQTGVITFRTLPRSFMTAPVTYAAPGVILESPISMTGTVEPGLRANPGPITITATQNGETSRYVFDLKAYLSAYCGYVPSQPPVNPPTGGNLTLLAPTYDCGSGALTFRTSGGDGSPIEYQAAGITGWTTNPDQFVDRDSRTANDVKPFLLMARQNGQVVTYTWDLKAACGRARLASLEPEFTPTLTVLGNPVTDQLRVVIRGAAGGSLRLQLTDTRGRLIENRVVEPTAGETEQVFDVSRQAPGLLLLRTTSGKQVLTTKVLKR